MKGSVHKVLESGGNEVQVHTQCVAQVLQYVKMPASPHVNFTGGWDGFKYYNPDD